MTTVDPSGSDTAKILTEGEQQREPLKNPGLDFTTLGFPAVFDGRVRVIGGYSEVPTLR
jgi:hypothetical protein